MSVVVVEVHESFFEVTVDDVQSMVQNLRKEKSSNIETACAAFGI